MVPYGIVWDNVYESIGEGNAAVPRVGNAWRATVYVSAKCENLVLPIVGTRFYDVDDYQ